MKAVVGQSKGRRVLRRLSGKLPTTSASVRLTVVVIALVVYGSTYFFGSNDSFLSQFWPFCILLGVTLMVSGDFLLNHGRWVSGDIARIAGFACVNLGMVLFVVWGWVSGEEAWFWYSTLVYGSILIFMLGWNSRRSSGGPRVR
jgi:hypothetical protein